MMLSKHREEIMKPRILLSASPNNANYINAVKGCGGIPFASYLPEVDTDYDGLILCGGVEPVKLTLKEMSVNLLWQRHLLKPGSPFWEFAGVCSC